MPNILFVHVMCSFFISSFGYSPKYTQTEFDNAWKKMTTRDKFYKPLQKQMGCWPKNTITYSIHYGFTYGQYNHILNHINQIQNKTCLRWVEKNPYAEGLRKSLEFAYSKKVTDCYTKEVGDEKAKKGIISIITLGDECFDRESVIHEMMHALGFLHEHQRIDRDCYVKVEDKYAQSDLEFKIVYDDSTFEKWPYDKESVTHYTRLGDALKDKNEPFQGEEFEQRLPVPYRSWSQKGHRTGVLSCMDVHKIKYRYCGAPDFCDLQPKMCKDIDEEEVKLGCKYIYADIAKHKLSG